MRQARETREKRVGPRASSSLEIRNERVEHRDDFLAFFECIVAIIFVQSCTLSLHFDAFLVKFKAFMAMQKDLLKVTSFAFGLPFFKREAIFFQLEALALHIAFLGHVLDDEILFFLV